MKIGIVGLGLIGGSLAHAFKEICSHTVYACDTDSGTMLAARLNGVVDGELNEKNIGELDFLVLCIYSKGAVEYMKKHAQYISPSTIVCDTCGTKSYVCSELFPLSREYGFTFIGTHPMAGTQYSGFLHSRASIFKGATILFCSDGQTETLEQTERLKQLFISAGFGSVVFTTPEYHDKQIAYTSQLAHVVSNAYIKSPQAQTHRGYSAGSYKDMTRVAQLNVPMWSDLFLENSENLVYEIDHLIECLKKYSRAIKDGDREELNALLREGTESKASAEKRQ